MAGNPLFVELLVLSFFFFSRERTGQLGGFLNAVSYVVLGWCGIVIVAARQGAKPGGLAYPKAWRYLENLPFRMPLGGRFAYWSTHVIQAPGQRIFQKHRWARGGSGQVSRRLIGVYMAESWRCPPRPTTATTAQDTVCVMLLSHKVLYILAGISSFYAHAIYGPTHLHPSILSKIMPSKLSSDLLRARPVQLWH